MNNLGIVPIQEKNQKRPYSFLVYGRSGTGKTTMATAGEKVNPLVLDIKEDGTSVTDKGFVIDIQDTNHFDYVVQNLQMAKEQTKFNVLIVDTVGKLQQIVMKSVLKGDLSKKAIQQDYGVVANRMIMYIDALKQASKVLNFHLVFVGHEKESSGTFGDGTTINPSVSVDLQAKVQTYLEGAVDVIAHTRIKQVGPNQSQFVAKIGGDTLFTTKIRTTKKDVNFEIVDPTLQKIIAEIKGA